MRVDAIIPAGGTGRRIGGPESKQYVDIAGVPILARTLQVFHSVGEIERIIVIVPQGDVVLTGKTIIARFGFSKVMQVVVGGKERQDSVRNGLVALGAGGDDDIVVIHDAVRPFVTADLIRASINECLEHQAVTLGVPVKDTIKKVETNGAVVKTLDRAGLWLTQTPQTFRKGIIIDAYRRADQDAFYGTDDASLVERIGFSVRMLMGSYDNIKITTPEDLEYADYLLQNRKVTGY